MELEIRDKEGNFIVSFKNFLGDFIFKFLMADARMKLEIKKFGGVNYRVFVNTSDQIVSGANDMVEIFVRPGHYVKIVKL